MKSVKPESIRLPPTAKQLKYLKDLKYAGPDAGNKEAAWKLLQELKKD